MTLLERWNFMSGLVGQLPPAPVRVVYAKAGQALAAAIIEDRRAIIDHKLYWGAFRRHSEALYVCGLLNSEIARGRIADLQSRGRWGVRDLDKLVFDLPIPRFDPRCRLHLDLMRAALEAERIAGTCLLPPGIHFVTARRLVRRALTESGVSDVLDALVTRLLD